ncbi:hypothetical protein RLIN73S_04615 [Rhodanobacter lindaniclasticus]
MGDIGEFEQALLGGHLRVEHHLQQQVAEFVAKIGPVLPVDRVGNFVGLLDRVGGDRGKILFHIPRATDSRIAQARHDGEQIIEAVSGHKAGVSGEK